MDKNPAPHQLAQADFPFPAAAPVAGNGTPDLRQVEG
jgi:hypothetical protein